MERFEYAIGPMSIIAGLGLADLAISLHRSVLLALLFAPDTVNDWSDGL